MVYHPDGPFDPPQDPASHDVSPTDLHGYQPLLHETHGPGFSGYPLNSGIEPVTNVAIPNTQIVNADHVLDAAGIDHVTLAQVHGEIQPVSLSVIAPHLNKE